MAHEDDDYPSGTLYGWPHAPVGVPRHIAESHEVPIHALGLYTYLLTKPAGTPIDAAAIAQERGLEPLRLIEKALQELRNLGLILSDDEPRGEHG